MKYIQLGNSDLNVSEIAFGCMSLQENEKEGISILHDAYEKGINLFDTADIYSGGANETLVGKALHAVRKKVFIASKVGNQVRKDGAGLDWNPGRDHIISAVELSLKRLQTDYIDLYQLHGGTINDPIDETIEAFELLKQQGKIRFYGISSIRPNVIREYVKRSSIVSVMMQYSLLDRRPEEACLDLLKKHHIGVLARGSVAQGLLVNKTPRPYLGHTPEQVGRAAASIAAISSPGSSPAQTAIRYALAHDAVASAVVGIRTSAQLAEAVAVGSLPPLSGADLSTLQDQVPAESYKEHR